MKRKNTLLAIVLALMAGLSGCQKNPDSSIVVNKDLDKLIEKAQDGESAAGVEDLSAYDTYQTTLEDDSLGVKVTVDAKVDIPKTDRMSVIHVKQKSISQELLNKVQEELVSGEQLYDGGVTVSLRKKSDIETEIRVLQSEIRALENSSEDYDEESIEVLREEYQGTIDSLQEEYENTPTEIVWKGNESDGLLHRTEEMNQRDGANEFYSWEYDMNPDGEVYYAVNDGSDGSYISVFVQNNENYGNCLRYRKSRQGYIFVATAYVGSSNLDDPYANMIWKADEDVPEGLLERMTDGTVSLTAGEEEATTISLEEAQKTAEDFLKKTGLDAYEYYEGGLYCEIMDIRSPETSDLKYSTHYILRYVRDIDGAFVTFDRTSKHAEGWNGDDYVKKDWPAECIELRISDDGIVGFDYNAPLEEMETVVDSSAMKTFEEIKNIFEKMVIVANAQEGVQVFIEIDRVVLGYARISEADSYDTGLLIPVWDFQGRRTYGNGLTDYGSLLTVNAIDGSVIDRSLGY